MPTFYLGHTTDGRLVSRKSTRSDFSHAAISTSPKAYGLPNFSTSAAGAAKLFEGAHCRAGGYEVVAVRKVDGREYHAAVAAEKARKAAKREG